MDDSYAARILADVRRREAASVDGRLPMPEVAEWDIFPFDGQLRVKKLDDPVYPEPGRVGETAAECDSCKRSDADFLWTNDNWRLRTTANPEGLPATLLLEPRGHYDLADLPTPQANEMGALFLRIEQALLSLGGIARVHINRWGDGGAHLHWWFLARPEGLTQLMGSCSSLWLDVLPPRPQDEWDQTMRRVVDAMRKGD